jgi:hypothetical protein
MPGGSGAVKLTWDAGKDDLTPTAALVYHVYVADSGGTFDYTNPTLVTDPGVTDATVPHLYDGHAVYRFVVRARDAAGNLDANTTGVASSAGMDTTPPAFAGCRTAIADSAGSAVVSWDAAVDDTTPASLLSYDIFASTTDGMFDFTMPTATVAGALSQRVTGLQSNATVYFVCRARDFSGNEDTNTLERATKTLLDDVPPTFAGTTGAVVDMLARTVHFTWAPATDDKTPQALIVYDVYQGGDPGGEDFKAPPLASSSPGATDMLVTDLTPDTTLFWVVRARDQAGNHDANHVETRGTIGVSFSRQVQVLLSRECAVAGCHVPGNPPASLPMVPGFAYDALVNTRSTEVPSRFRVLPSDSANSYFYMKVSLNPPPVGWQMPAPATGSVLSAGEKDFLRRWIDQGAVNN